MTTILKLTRLTPHTVEGVNEPGTIRVITAVTPEIEKWFPIGAASITVKARLRKQPTKYPITILNTTKPWKGGR